MNNNLNIMENEKTAENQVLALDNLDASKLPELKGMKENQLKLVEENPYIEIEDNKTYEVAKQRRTALLKGRTSLESQEKLIASKLSNFRKKVGEETKKLIDITLPHEQKQQEEVKRYEAIKELERIEREQAEQKRIETIKSKVSELENNCYSIINSWGVEVLQDASNLTFTGMDTDFDFEEYDILYQQAKLRVQETVESKIKTLQEKENQRLENERLAREKAEADAKLKELQEQQEKERLDREEKEREQMEKVFEVRKNRLLEIGLVLSNGVFMDENSFYNIQENIVFKADVIDFENIITEAKTIIQDAKYRIELEKEREEKLIKENKSRQKRLAKDKAIYKNVLDENLGSFPIVFDSNQKEIKDFSIDVSNRVTDLYKQLLTELENL